MATASILTEKYKFHYVYKITNLSPTNNKKFYIGVHSCNCHPENDNYWGSSTYLNEAINSQGYSDFVKEILSTWETREEANTEEERIHGEINVENHPEYYNQSNAKKNFFNGGWSDETKQKVSELNKIRCAKPEVKKQKSETTTKLWENPEYREKITKKTKEKWTDPEFREKQIKVMKEGFEKPEVREKISDGVKKSWQDPEEKKRRSKINKKAANTPEEKKRRSETLKKQWKNTEFKNKMSKEAKERMNTDKAKKEMSDRAHTLWSNNNYRKKITNILRENAKKKIKIFELIDPNGIKYTIKGVDLKNGLNDFAKKMNMSKVTLQCLCNGTYTSPTNSKYFGWKGKSYILQD